jgi:hypothetical protein
MKVSGVSPAAGQKNGQFDQKRNLRFTAEFAENAEKNNQIISAYSAISAVR